MVWAAFLCLPGLRIPTAQSPQFRISCPRGSHSFAFSFGSAFAEAASRIGVEELLKTAESALFENRQAYPSFN